MFYILGVNLLSLRTWRNTKGAHYVHSLYCFFSFGAFFGPMLAKPFLSVRASEGGAKGNNDTTTTEISNGSNTDGVVDVESRCFLRKFNVAFCSSN